MAQRVRIATVFGGTGFLGRRIAGAMREDGIHVRVAVRTPEKSRFFGKDGCGVEVLQADIRDPATTGAALDGADAVVNAVSLYTESGNATFRQIHVDGARQLAEGARDRGVRVLIQVSGIGADSSSSSRYIQSRGQGESAVRQVFDGAVIVRPAVMFGPDDSFLNMLVSLVRYLPVLPIFGTGATRLQPAYVDDVAKAVSRIASDTPGAGPVYELGGPEIHTYRQLVERVASRAGRRRLLAPVPFGVWKALAAAARLFPNSPLSRTQVELMQRHNVAAPELPSFRDVDIEPTAVDPVLTEILERMSRSPRNGRNAGRASGTGRQDLDATPRKRS
ncbi:MAG: complex I NDUFA9 subunit family protein [Alphaproteobacteria bacterium]